MIHFNVPPFVGTEFKYMQEAVANHKICGDGPFTKKCNEWLENRFNAKKVMLTTSGSSALDMAALLCGLNPGDEVILPSYTFSSTANAFVLAGAKLVFVDIRPDTMNIDENRIEPAITKKTKVICVVHYAGVSCEMDKIMAIAKKYKLKVVEDAAQAVMSTYKGQALGTIGDFGDSYLQSDLNAAYLWAQLEVADEINKNRIDTWNRYYKSFKELEAKGIVQLPYIPQNCVHNAHMFYIKCKDLETRQKFIKFMKENDILCVFHYVPLHSAPAGLKFGRFDGDDEFTTQESDRLVRLPLYFGISEEDLNKVIDKTLEFFLI